MRFGDTKAHIVLICISAFMKYILCIEIKTNDIQNQRLRFIISVFCKISF